MEIFYFIPILPILILLNLSKLPHLEMIFFVCIIKNDEIRKLKYLNIK